MHGWLILDKPVGPGSTEAVSAVKRALRAGGYGKIKVGHGGTLDPLASGVLPVALGEATKLAGPLSASGPRYVVMAERQWARLGAQEHELYERIPGVRSGRTGHFGEMVLLRRLTPDESHPAANDAVERPDPEPESPGSGS